MIFDLFSRNDYRIDSNLFLIKNKCFSLLDFVNVIGYDFHEYDKDKPIARHHSSLYTSKNDNLVSKKVHHFLIYLLQTKKNILLITQAWLIKNWLKTDLDKSKINVGLSTFGRSYNVAYNRINSLEVPTISYGLNNGTISYGDVCKFLLKNETTFIYNEQHQVPFAYNGYDLIAFDNEKSLSVKSKYLTKLKIGGIMLFALNYDDVYGDCKRSNDESTKFPLHEVVFKTIEIASLVNEDKLR